MSEDLMVYRCNLGGSKVKVRHLHRSDEVSEEGREIESKSAKSCWNSDRRKRLLDEIERHEKILNGVEEVIENSEAYRTWLDRKVEVGKFEGEFRERGEESTRREDELGELLDIVEELKGLMREHEEEIERRSEELRERSEGMQRDLSHEEANGVYAEEKLARRTLDAFAARKRKEVKSSRIRVEKLRKRLKMIERYEGSSEVGEDR